MPCFISKRTISKFLLICTPVVFFTATSGMILKNEPFSTWFYSFAWWSYIFFTESLLYYRGHRSLLFFQPFRFLQLLPLSVTIWLVFEAFNFRLKNWHYLHVPFDRDIRWLGYTIAFATVLPAILSTANLMDFLGLFRNTKRTAVKITKMKDWLVWLGVAMLILPILLPKIFFPLVWLGFIFAFEPFNYKHGADSLLRDLESGSLRNLSLLLLSGFLCGILWECWNFWAGSKWSYTIPYFGFAKVFEMPILGFLGFPFFAVECYVMVNASFLLLNRMVQIRSQKLRTTLPLLVVIIALSFDIMVVLGIDAFTVVSFKAASQ